MGQTYYVEMELKDAKEDNLKNLMNSFINKKEQAGRARFSLVGRDRDSLDDLIKIMITPYGFAHKGDTYRSFFDASYGWETLMSEMFEAMAPALGDGSSLYVEPDEGSWKLVVENGKAA